MNRWKKLVAFIAGILAIAVCVCILPAVQRVERSATGTLMCDTGEQSKTVTVTLCGTKRNYLFREDVLNLSITVSGYEADIQTLGPIFSLQNDIYFTTIMGYDPVMNHYVGGYLAFDVELSEFILTGLVDGTYVAATDGDTDLQTVYQRFAPFFAKK